MGFEQRKRLMRKIGRDRDSKVILYATSDRDNMGAQIANDAFDYFVHHLDRIWPAKKISLVLHTNGGNTSAAWRIINLLRTFCDDLEVIVPTKAHSAGTLMCLGADRIIMTKQATLGPIDPSLTGPLNPQVPSQPGARVPVSVEAVQGYLDLAKGELGVKSEQALSALLMDLAGKVHPLVLGQIFRTRAQIRTLADRLLAHQGVTGKKKEQIIEFLCSESGSHDRTVNRREARELGLTIEKPSESLYKTIRSLYEDIAESLEIRSRFDPMLVLGQSPNVVYTCQRVLLESVDHGSWCFVTEGTIRRVQISQSQPGGTPVPVTAAETTPTFEGWRKT